MKATDINIRDPFILKENGIYYLYGTRARNFGRFVGGFDVYTSTDLENWSEAHECFNSENHGMNIEVNWAPEVHKYNGDYYMFATFTRENKLRGTFILKATSPMGPFVPYSEGPVTPVEWECLDGTLYIENEKPYLVFCHEHTQIIDGTICYVELSPDLKKAISEPYYLFHATSPYYVTKSDDPDKHYITDGPFMHRRENGDLYMLWSTHLNNKYAQCLVKFTDNTITGNFTHEKPLIESDGGHGMLFRDGDNLMLTYHSPNQTDYERPVFIKLNELK